LVNLFETAKRTGKLTLTPTAAWQQFGSTKGNSDDNGTQKLGRHQGDALVSLRFSLRESGVFDER